MVLRNSIEDQPNRITPNANAKPSVKPPRETFNFKKIKIKKKETVAKFFW